jgi:hypothetical protein
MPVYFFHIRDDSKLIEDAQGTELADLTAAQEEARASIREFAIEALQQRLPVDRLRIEIRDERGATLDIVRFQDIAGGDPAT